MRTINKHLMTETQTQPQAEVQDDQFNPIFEEIKGITPDGALNVLIQAAGQAQAAGALTVRDSVMVAQAINVLRPGSI